MSFSAALKYWLAHPVRGPALILLGAALVMATVFYFQYGLGLAPCELCYWQRIPYYFGIGALLVALAAGIVAHGPCFPSRLLLALTGIGFLIGAGIAAYHVGVEQTWWPGPAACSGNPFGGDPAEALQRLLAAPVVRCDEVPWALFGISMAGYNILLSLALGAAAIYAARFQGGNNGQRL